MQNGYIGVLVMFTLSAVLTGLIVLLASILGPKKKSPGKDIPYEAGKDPFSLPHSARTSVHFYVIAMVFIIFDVELAFLFPWAVIFRELGWIGFAQVLFFIFFVLLAYLYAWKNKALDTR